MKIALIVLFVAVAAAKPNTYGAYNNMKTTGFVYEAPALKTPSYSYEMPETKVVKKIIPIVSQEVHDDNYGTFKSQFVSGDGTTLHESGQLKDLGAKEGPSVVKQGAYTFTSPEGKTFTVNWSSDENGFHATGDHLPTSPPIPEEIQKVIRLSKAGTSYAHASY